MATAAEIRALVVAGQFAPPCGYALNALVERDRAWFREQFSDQQRAEWHQKDLDAGSFRCYVPSPWSERCQRTREEWRRGQYSPLCGKSAVLLVLTSSAWVCYCQKCAKVDAAVLNYAEGAPNNRIFWIAEGENARWTSCDDPRCGLCPGFTKAARSWPSIGYLTDAISLWDKFCEAYR